MYRYLSIFISFICLNAVSQTVSIKGIVTDTVAKTPLINSVVMAIKVKDSLLVKFTRTDEKGFFKLDSLPLDTYQVVLSHPLFSDQIYFVMASSTNHAFDFNKIALPPKSISMNEVVVLGYKDKIYYKGDTLIYTADSFKVKQNAVVEDLLKKLPGIKVDSKGKIYSQGKAVDQVLVDGDEFFGTDPTVATRNLGAKTVESVQVYDKKNDNPSDQSANETLKVMNLKLKEEAKKGYFGKFSGAGDFSKFYEGELLANKFKNKFKMSVFGLATNTPQTKFGWDDAYRYGLNNETNMEYGDDGSTYYYSSNQKQNGIPKTFKTGFYYTDKWSKKTKVSFNYTYYTSNLYAVTNSTSQYFLTDTTYKTKSSSISKEKTESNALNFTLNQNLDSLSEIEIKSKLQYSTNNNGNYYTDDFFTNADTLKKNATVGNGSNSTNYSLANTFKLTRNFKKKDRKFLAIYNYTTSNNESKGILQTKNIFYGSLNPTDSTDQQKTNSNSSISQMATLTYTEPVTKKIKLEFSYDFNTSKGIQNKKALDFVNGEYSLENSVFSNNFENKRTANRFGTKVIYEEKKKKASVGARYRIVDIQNTNLVSLQKLTQQVNNILPFFNYRYKFSDNESIHFDYQTDSRQPTITQLQPVPDNSSPNQIRLGNPDLLPTFMNRLNLSYNIYKPVSSKYMWTGLDFSTTSNDLSNSVVYETNGRATYQAVNVQGNYNASIYAGGEVPLFKRVLLLAPNFNFNYSNNADLINGQKNITKEASTSGGLELTIETDTLVIAIGGNFSYSDPSSTLNTQSNKPYSSSDYTAEFSYRFKHGYTFATDANYFINSKRTQGYNLKYFLWNASFSKSFFKTENLIVSLNVKDILDQNINTSRSVQDNVITDTKTNIIGRYLLLKLVYKFNSNKAKEEEDDEF